MRVSDRRQSEGLEGLGGVGVLTKVGVGRGVLDVLVHDLQLLPEALVLKLKLEERVEHRLVLARVWPRHSEKALGPAGCAGPVADRARVPGRLGRGDVSVACGLEEDVLVVLCLEAVVNGQRFARVEAVLKRVAVRGEVVRVDKPIQTVPDQLFGRPAGEVFDRLGRDQNLACRTEHVHKILLSRDRGQLSFVLTSNS